MTYSWGQKFTSPLQNLQNVNYFTKIRGIIQNACYCLFSTDLNKIVHIKYVYIESTRENNSWIYKNNPVQKFISPWFLNVSPSIWWNPKWCINKAPFLWKEWVKKGIVKLDDLNENCSLKSFEHLQQQYDLDPGFSSIYSYDTYSV